MIRADVLQLVEEQQPRGMFDATEETLREVFCTVRSVGMNESYLAKSQGLHPELVFELSDIAEYKNEKECIYDGVRYRIIRSYATVARVELIVERIGGYNVVTAPKGT